MNAKFVCFSFSPSLLAVAITCILATLLVVPVAAQSGPVTFTSKAYSPWSGSVAVGDFNRDGRLDVASISGGEQGLVLIYRGGSNGFLTKTAEYPVSTDGNGAWVYTADLNSDGELDLAITKEFKPELEMWFGNGDGTFQFAQTLHLNLPSPKIAFADVDQSDTVDIVTFERSENIGSQVYVSNGLGSFSTNSSLYVEAQPGTFDFAVANFTGDRKPDLLFVSPDAIRVYKGAGDFTAGFSLAATTSISLPHAAGRIAAGSLNRDLAMDVAVRTGTNGTTSFVHVFVNNGAGKFILKSIKAVGTADGGDEIAAGDLNNDSVMDLVIPRSYMATDASIKTTAYLMNDGTGIVSGPYVAANHAGVPILRRFNYDSRMDVVLPSINGVVTLMANNSPSNCTPPGSGSLAAKICTPSNGGTVGTTFTVRAAGNSPAGVGRLELWVDGIKKYEVWNDQLARTISVIPGRRRITVRAYDRYVGYVNTTIYVTAQ